MAAGTGSNSELRGEKGSSSFRARSGNFHIQKETSPFTGLVWNTATRNKGALTTPNESSLWILTGLKKRPRRWCRATRRMQR